ncbi:MAG: response regulator [Candidatus Omnitrophica bacterium]|nr:response regulator [Candidatus Omnitrophota bacterium]
MVRKVLIIDDEKGLIDAVKSYLEPRGFDVISALNGNEGLEKMREKPDVVLLDVVMPGPDGFEVLRRIRHDHDQRHTEIIMLTSRRESNSIMKAQDLGAVDYIMKPFRLEELLAVINKHT